MAEQYKMDLPERFLKERYADDIYNPYEISRGFDMEELEGHMMDQSDRGFNPIELAAVKHLFSGGKVLPQSVIDAYDELPFGENYYDKMSPSSFNVSPDGKLSVGEGIFPEHYEEDINPGQYSFYENLGLPVPSATQDRGFGGLLGAIGGASKGERKMSVPRVEDFMNEAGY
tara:strand:+ start:220 stop:735 length:516 start_codon:yes stop_codon:yes gene_type:complete